MIKKMLSDPKYLITLIVTFAGIFSPLWLSWVQSNETGVTVDIVSLSALQPLDNGAVSDLKMVLGDTVLTEPYLSVFRITNEGRKPILSRDFEAPLEVLMGKAQKIVRARITEKSPKDIQAKLSLDGSAIQLMPTLLNPNDSITVEVISTGGVPTLSTSARIAGVGTVPVRDTSKKGPKPLVLLSSSLLAFAFAIPAVAGFWRTLGPSKFSAQITLRKRTVLALFAVAFFASEGMLIMFLDEFDLSSFGHTVLGMILLVVVASPFARMLEQSSITHIADKQPK